MADTRSKPEETRPKEREAMDIWESLPEAERTYEEVAARMNPPITTGRAGVYVRDALRLNNKEHLLPQRGRRGNGGNAAPMVEEDENPIHDLERMLAQVDERITSLNDQLTEVTKAADEFDAVAAVNAEKERLAKLIEQAQATYDEFDSNTETQTKWVNDQERALNTRKADVSKSTEQRVTTLSKKKAGLEKVIELASSDPDVAAMFAKSISDDEKSDPEKLENEPPEVNAADQPTGTEAQ